MLSAVVVIVQAVLIAGILADVIIGGQGPAEVAIRLIWLAVVIAVRAGAGLGVRGAWPNGVRAR